MRKPLFSTGPASINDPAGKFVRMAINKVDGNTGKVVPYSQDELLLNPESISDSKTSLWVANQIPGQSNPIMQWMGGGPRTVTFTALVTLDTSDFMKSERNIVSDLTTGAINAVGSIASAFAGITLPSVASLLNNTEPGEGENLSIENYLNYYRSLLYPVYNNGRLFTSPPLCVLSVGRMLGNKASIPAVEIDSTVDLWVLTDLGINITKALPNLVPVEAEVSFTFIQYAMSSMGSDHFTPETVASDSVGSQDLSQTILSKIGF